ncbi:hypothetical protein [Microbacterium telephonicum]|uniref:Uncharacterized protein n=1 Tax=Microbacterium telephonicum TaxID=1714841 RepID=A0A498CF05_9MICO|nr:hypothetical protein [Microbacterium telephonicum]RLK52896.1 hypothetical protein C7474_0858 [Microbacterium telephonicum]
MILPSSRADIAAAEAPAAAETRPADADAAAARTRADYGRVSRWGLGLLGTAGALVAGALLSFAASVTASGVDPLGDLLFAGFMVLVAAVFAVPSVWLLIALHRSGRRLARAAGFWAGLPYRQGRRRPTKGDWFAVRFLGFSSDLFLRLITSALAGLAAVFTISVLIRGVVIGQGVDALVLWASWSVVFASVCAGQFGGVQRIQNGYLPRDPASLTRGR